MKKCSCGGALRFFFKMRAKHMSFAPWASRSFEKFHGTPSPLCLVARGPVRPTSAAFVARVSFASSSFAQKSSVSSFVCVVDDTTVSCGCHVLPVTTVSCGVNYRFRYVRSYFSLLLFLPYRQHFYLLVCRNFVVCSDRVVRTYESSVQSYLFLIYLLRVHRSSVALSVIVSDSFFKTFWMRFGLRPQRST
jgi:hypothetical protein